MGEATGTPSDLTWEDVFAVCKLMGVEYVRDLGEGAFMFSRNNQLTIFSDPSAALEFITAPKHKLEK